VDVHKNAPMTPAGRLRLVEALAQGSSVAAVAEAFRVDRKTVRKWRRRFQLEGRAGLNDRTCRPKRSPRRIARGTAQRIVTLRRRRWTMERIAKELGVSRATVSRTLARAGLSLLSALDPVPIPVRYERQAPGELLHIDIKKLGRIGGRVGHRITGDRTRRVEGVGWEHVYVAVDDHSRLAFSKIMPAENRECAAAFLDAAVAYYQTLGIRIERVITDNAKVFGSAPFVQACERHGISRRRTRFYRPQTNGKAERFIQTALREWAYARAYRTSAERALHLPQWLHAYNWHRPHAGLAGHSPISRARLGGDDVLRLHS
jgi:transposase InsO family protein